MELYSTDKIPETFKVGLDEYLFYRREPTTEERISFMSESVKKINGKVISNYENLFKFKFDFGLALLTGFADLNDSQEPQFLFNGKMISSDPESPEYYKDWKQIISKFFVKEIIFLSVKVFEGIEINQNEPLDIETFLKQKKVEEEKTAPL